MMLLSFRFSHDCQLNLISKEFPEVTMTHWCNYKRDLLEINGRGRGKLESVERRLTELTGHAFKTVHRGSNEREETLVMSCFHNEESSIDEIIGKYGALVLHPLIYEGGWEYYRVVLLNENYISRLVQALEGEGRFEIISKTRMRGSSVKDSLIISTDELLAGMTKKQGEALLFAVKNGYYDVPRRTTFDRMSKLRGAKRTTFEEHVRKAEGKIIKSVSTHISFFINGGKSGPKALIRK